MGFFDSIKNIFWCGKGDKLYNSGRYSEAIKCYDKALKIDPNHELAKNNRK